MILFEDGCVVVCIKPVGMDSERDMPEALKAVCAGSEFLCVHRLDKAVGGVMVYAKNRASAAKLTAAMGENKFEKEYLAVLPGKPEADKAVLRDLLYRDAGRNKSFVVKRMRRGVKAAELEYRLLRASDKNALVLIRLHTGRTHQIRVQFASRGLPLLGDVKYGSHVRDCPIALFSCSLAFPHPKNGERMRFTALPQPTYPWNEFSPDTYNYTTGADNT